MAISVDEYYKKLYKTGEQQLLDQENLIRQQADAAIKASDESYNTQIADVKQTYEDAARRNEVQRVLNERHLERKAAEMGLTDSGLNRTQLTANQLSFANQQGDIDIARQKDINTLAAAMRAKRSELEGTRDSSIAQLKSDYDTSIRKQAADLYEKDIENQAKYTYRYDNNGNVVGQYTAADRKNEWSTLNTALDAGAFGNNLDAAAKIIYDFGMNYDLSDVERMLLLKKADISEDMFQNYINNGSVYTAASDYGNKGNTGQVNWDYRTDGPQRYYFKITKATNNWGGKNSVDNDDEVTIYYPDRVTKLAESIRIDKLPKKIRQDITNRTAGKKVSNKDYDFYYTADLKDINIPIQKVNK